MRMRSRLISTTTALLCLLAFAAATGVSATIARADIAKFINEQTVLVGEADLTKVDGAALEATALELAKTAGIIGAPGAATEAEAKQHLGQASKWINDIKQAGATSICIVMDSTAMQRTGPTVIIPVSDDKAAAIAKLIPLPGGAQPAPARPNPGMPQVVTVPGVGVMFGATASVNVIKALKPAPRADLSAALTNAGNAPIRLAFALDDKTRQEMTKNAPPMIMGKPTTLITKDFKWASAAITPPPNLSAKAVAQSTDAASAKSTDELIVSAIVMNQKGPNKFPDQLITLLTPQAQGSQLVLNLDAKQANEVAAALREPLARARQVALRVQSSSNIRQILQACLLYANENKGKYPDDMKALQAAMAKFNPGMVKRVMTNPAHPEIQPAYVYIKPAKGNAATAETVVIYESHKDFGNGINVGFADGHVEWVGQKQQFEQMLAKQAQE